MDALKPTLKTHSNPTQRALAILVHMGLGDMWPMGRQTRAWEPVPGQWDGRATSPEAPSVRVVRVRQRHSRPNKQRLREVVPHGRTFCRRLLPSGGSGPRRGSIWTAVNKTFLSPSSIGFADLLIDRVRRMLSNMCISVSVTEIICLSQSRVSEGRGPE